MPAPALILRIDLKTAADAHGVRDLRHAATLALRWIHADAREAPSVHLVALTALGALVLALAAGEGTPFLAIGILKGARGLGGHVSRGVIRARHIGEARRDASLT